MVPVNYRKIRARAEPDIISRRHLTTVKPFELVFCNVNAHKLNKIVSLLYDC